MHSNRGAAAAAVAAGGLTVLCLSQLPDGPKEADASAAQVRAFVAAHGDTVRASLASGALAAVALLVLAVLLRRHLTRAGAGLSAQLAPPAAAATAVVLLVGCALRSPLAREDLTGHDAAVQGWYALGDAADGVLDLSAVTGGLLVGVLSVAAWNRRGLPRGLAVPGAVIAAAGLLSALTPLEGPTEGLLHLPLVVSYVLWPVWLVVAGVFLAVGRTARRVGAPSPAGPVDPTPVSAGVLAPIAVSTGSVGPVPAAVSVRSIG